MDPFWDSFQPVEDTGRFDPATRSPNTGVSGYGPGGVTRPPVQGPPVPLDPNNPRRWMGQEFVGVAPGTPTPPNYQRDYWAPDRAQVLTSQGLTDTSGKAWNGSTWGAPQAPSGGAGDPDAFGRAWMASGGRTVADLQKFVAEHPEFGATLFGSKGDKVKFGNGQEFDAVYAAGSGGLGGTWNATGGGPGGSLASLGYARGDWAAPWTQDFNAPTADQARNTPGVQFGIEEANRMMQNSAAARGTLLNGRVQQAIGASNVGNAMQAYGDVYDRGLGEYLLRKQNFQDNQDRPFGKVMSLAQLGKPSNG